ncbi:carbohydrate-binding protein [Aquimarina gracilis]
MKMNRIQRRLTFLAFILCYTAFAQNWTLVWQDEFTNGISNDWIFEIGNGNSGWGNNELQYYKRENATVENGNLVITARRESIGGFNYTSTRMKTQGRRSWKYGKVEARIAMPSFIGSWPAFWMLGDNISAVGWPACGEIDIMEHVNTETQTHGTIHWQDHNNTYANYSGATPVNSVTNFHVYTIEWDALAIKWFVDGNLYHEASIANGVNGTSEFHNNFFILLNMAIGGNWPGFNIDNTAFPARMLVDYVRVYQRTVAPSGPVTLFQHCDYDGYAVSLNEGSYTMSQLQALGFVDNDISSIQVQDGYQITIYEHDNFTGASLTMTANDDCLVNEGFNDIMSSAKVSKTTTPLWSILIEAEDTVVQSGTQTEACSEGGLNVGWIDTNDWMVWDVNIPNTGNYTVEYRVSSPNTGRTLQLEKAGGVPVYGILDIPNTGGWQNWTTVQHTVNLIAGAQQIAIKALSGGLNINWLRISSTTNDGLKAISKDITIRDGKLIAYPIPTSNTLTVRGLTPKSLLGIYDINGKLILETEVKGKEDLMILDVSGLQSGLYIVRDFKTGKATRFAKQ